MKAVPVDPATARGEAIQASSDSHRARRDNNSGSVASSAATATAPPAQPPPAGAAAAALRDDNDGDGSVASSAATATAPPAQSPPAGAASATAAPAAPALLPSTLGSGSNDIKKRPTDSMQERSSKRQVGVKEGAMVVRDPDQGAMVLWHLPFFNVTISHCMWEDNEFWRNHWRTDAIKRQWWHGDKIARDVLRHGKWGEKEKGEEESEWEDPNEEARAYVATLMDQLEEGEGEGDEDTVSWEVARSQKRWGDKEKGED